ncbi:MAG: hypothetical protein WB676_06985 [Bryobacteraceae bacterium]
MNTERLCKLCARPVSQHGDSPDDCARHAILRIEAIEQRAASLIKLVGEPGTCRGCGAEIFWVKAFKSGKPVPYDPSGITHFATCSKAQEFRKPMEQGR